MNNFVIGDIQGCYKGLRKVLKKAQFDSERDKLWSVGDLIARGDDSLDTLKFLFDLGDQFECVLGNHDLHLLAIAHGLRTPKSSDKLSSLIKHKDFPMLVDWLKKRPLAVKPAKATLITHAGLYPAWSLKQAVRYSQRIEKKLNSEHITSFLRNMYGNEPSQWDESLKGENLDRFIVNAMTRMRFVSKQCELDFATKTHPSSAPKNLTPWFCYKNKNLKKKHRVIFGHWAALNGDVSLPKYHPAKVFALDTGYVWGNKMSLLHLETEKIIQVNA